MPRGPRKKSAKTQAARGNPGKRGSGARKKSAKKKAASKKAPAKKAAKRKATAKKATRKKKVSRKAAARSQEPGVRDQTRKRSTDSRPPTPDHRNAAAPKVSAPSWLGSVAVANWNRVYDKFAERGVVTELDFDALAIYCDAWQELHDADVVLQREGEFITTDKGNVLQHPAVWKRNKAIDRLRKVGEQLGLTPNSRRGLELTDDKPDALSDFLEG